MSQQRAQNVEDFEVGKLNCLVQWANIKYYLWLEKLEIETLQIGNMLNDE
jgi:hypothetical protein